MAAPRAPLVIEVEHAREWLRSRGTLSPGELTIARAELMKRVKSLDGVVAEVVAPHVSDAARLWAELSDGWSSALAELERDGHASRSAITGGLSSKQLSDIDAVVQKAGPSALRECAEACLSAALVELPALARDRGASRARHLALSRAAASAERSAVLAERRAKSEADALGLDADGVPTGAELAGALLRGAAVRAAAAFCSARARASHGAAGADAVAVPSLEAVWRGASPLSERSDVIEDLQVMLAFLLAAERDTAALQEDARAALADGAPALALLGPAPPSVLHASAADVGSHRRAVVLAMAAVTSVPMAAAELHARRGPDDPAHFAGMMRQAEASAAFLRKRAAEMQAEAARCAADVAEAEAAAADLIGRARGARALLARGLTRAVGREVTVIGLEAELGIAPTSA